jgi:hypothetical protein
MAFSFSAFSASSTFLEPTDLLTFANFCVCCSCCTTSDSPLTLLLLALGLALLDLVSYALLLLI